VHSRVVILLGPPGAGKGTQAVRVSSALVLPHIATGDLFRENLARGTPLGLRAQKYIEAGQLAPDDLVVEMLLDRVGAPDCENGYLLDGFPRTIVQAETLAKHVPREWELSVVDIEVDDKEILVRIAGRLVCKACGSTFNGRSVPAVRAGVCNACGGVLYKRKDDEAGVVAKRLEVYRTQTTPLVAYYKSRGVLCSVDGKRSPDEVFQDVMSCIRNHA
jgi:adenylate kinase